MPWPTGAPVTQRRRRRRSACIAAELADLGADRAVRVHDTLRVGRRARRVRDRARARSGRPAAVPSSGSSATRSANAKVSGRASSPTTATHSRSGRSARIVSRLARKSWWPNAIGGDERLHARARAGCSDLLRAVEVHDRHDDRAEVRDRVERRRRFEPVRQLERDRRRRADAAGAQPGRDPARERVDVAERAAVRAAIGAHRERLRGGVVQPVGEHARRASASSQKPSRDVAARELGIDGARREVHGFGLARPV